MQYFVPNIYFYVGSEVDARDINIIISQLDILLKSKGLKVNLGIYCDDLEGYLQTKRAFLTPADRIVYYFHNHVTDEDSFKKEVNNILVNADKAYVCCWPYANVRPFLDEHFGDIGNNLNDIIKWIMAEFTMESIIKQ